MELESWSQYRSSVELLLETILGKLDFSTSRIVVLESFMRKYRTSHEDFSGALTRMKDSNTMIKNKVNVADANVVDLRRELQSLKNQLVKLEGELKDLKNEKQAAVEFTSQVSSHVLENQLAQEDDFEEKDACRDVVSISEDSNDQALEQCTEFALGQKQERLQPGAMKGASFLELLPSAKQSTAWVPLPSSGSQKSIVLLFPPPRGMRLAKNESIHHILAGARSNASLVHMVNLAESILGQKKLDNILHGPLEEFKDFGTATYLASLFRIPELLEKCSEAVLKPWAVAGLHEGEYAALCFAGVLSFEDALRLVILRSELSQKVYQGPEKHQTMSVGGFSCDELEQLCREASTREEMCFVVEKYTTLIFVCGGTQIAMSTLKDLVNEAGRTKWGKRWQDVSMWDSMGSGTSILLRGAQLRFREELQKYLPRMSPPRCALYMNASVTPIQPGTDPAVILQLLADCMTLCVDWGQSMRSMIEHGGSEIYDVGPTSWCKDRMKNINVNAWKRTVRM